MLLKSAEELFRATKDSIGFFEKGIFPFKGSLFKRKEVKSKEKSKEKSEEAIE